MDLILRTAERNVVMANFILIDVVVSHNEKWFDCFIDTLTKEGYKNIASQIREDLDAECEGIDILSIADLKGSVCSLCK